MPVRVQNPAADIANLRKLKFVIRGGAMRSIQELSKLATTPAEKESKE